MAEKENWGAFYTITSASLHLTDNSQNLRVFLLAPQSLLKYIECCMLLIDTIKREAKPKLTNK